MTARQIIEARLGRKLAPTRELAPDERQAIKRLAIQLIRNAAIKHRDSTATSSRPAVPPPGLPIPHDSAPGGAEIHTQEHDG